MEISVGAGTWNIKSRREQRLRFKSALAIESQRALQYRHNGDFTSVYKGGCWLTTAIRGDYNYPRLAEVVEWQTRVTQNHLLARAWGFESLLRHSETGAAWRLPGFFIWYPAF